MCAYGCGLTCMAHHNATRTYFTKWLYTGAMARLPLRCHRCCCGCDTMPPLLARALTPLWFIASNVKRDRDKLADNKSISIIYAFSVLEYVLGATNSTICICNSEAASILASYPCACMQSIPASFCFSALVCFFTSILCWGRSSSFSLSISGQTVITQSVARRGRAKLENLSKRIYRTWLCSAALHIHYWALLLPFTRRCCSCCCCCCSQRGDVTRGYTVSLRNCLIYVNVLGNY